jgi:hypothetical protein
MIYLFSEIGFKPVAAVGRLVKNREQTARKEKYYTKQYKHHTKIQNTQNRTLKYETKKQT